MLEMFRRADDPTDYSHLYIGAGALYTAGYFGALASGYTDITQAAYLVPALACLGGIAGLSSQVHNA
jgi:NAD(P) transhydrogenase